jgi:phosphoglycolate phosphatase-like HAD superfamily hydrolase
MDARSFATFPRIFWDFDGVVKDSMAVKEEAFGDVFGRFGASTARAAMAHHSQNGGMSRFEKVPLYLERFAGVQPSKELVAQLCAEFADRVVQRVIDSAWIAGAKELLTRNPYGQRFALVTATPQDEIEVILSRCGISDAFDHVFGAPTGKANAIQSVVEFEALDPSTVLLIGDSASDFAAAKATGIAFLWRGSVDSRPADVPSVENFLEILDGRA